VLGRRRAVARPQARSQLTPGATLEVTTADICVPGYTKKVRDVPDSVKRQVYAAYGIQTHARVHMRSTI